MLGWETDDKYACGFLFAASGSTKSRYVHSAKPILRDLVIFFNAHGGHWRCEGSWTTFRLCLAVSTACKALWTYWTTLHCYPTFSLAQWLFYTPLRNITRNCSRSMHKQSKSKCQLAQIIWWHKLWSELSLSIFTSSGWTDIIYYIIYILCCL
jgi:hypothetical protein